MCYITSNIKESLKSTPIQYLQFLGPNIWAQILCSSINRNAIRTCNGLCNQSHSIELQHKPIWQTLTWIGETKTS
jgi:hypothetical protein